MINGYDGCDHPDEKMRSTIYLPILVLACIHLFTTCTRIAGRYEPQEGDIVFQSLPHCELVDAIEGVSGSPYSHCGVVVKLEGSWQVIEAIRNVHYTNLDPWIARGRCGMFSACRLKDKYRDRIAEWKRALAGYLGKPYDYSYDMDDEYIYCSELVYKAFGKVYGEEIGSLEKLGELNWRPYANAIAKLERGNPPLDRLMITPVRVSRAQQLTLVWSNFTK
jgi:uncharacterized protein YycO